MIIKTSASNKNILECFKKLEKKDRLAHAYLFVGPKKSGRSKTALDIAKLVNCHHAQTETFCGVCPSCIKIEAGNHPDIFVLSGEKETIKMEDIRCLLERIQLKAFESERKVFILTNIESLTPEAGNALLKTLEEPIEKSLLILTTSFPDKVLSTIVSRCQRIDFVALPPRVLKEKFIKEHHQDREVSHFLAYCFEGGIGKTEDQDFSNIFERKNQAIDQLFFVFDNEEYFKIILKDKKKTKEFLWFVFCSIRDLMLIKHGFSQQEMVHFDRWQDFKTIESAYSLVQLKEILDGLVVATQAVDDHFNMKVFLALIKEKIWRKSHRYN